VIKTVLLDDSDASLEIAAAALANGELVAFPTETVYGLGARADDEHAVRAIFEAKGRPEHKPLIVHVRDFEQAQRFTSVWPDRAERLARAFWPGPLTLVLPKAQTAIDAVTAGGSTVAVRAPAHPLAIRLLQVVPFAIAAPSANRSGEPPPVRASEVLAQLGGRIPYVLDGGATTEPEPSTIVDLSDDRGPAKILRRGPIDRGAIAQLIELA
jgi:L-threonylcarbamoyladenylate synthase